MKIYHSRPTCTALVLEGTQIIRFPSSTHEEALTKADEILKNPPSDPYSYGIFHLIKEDEPIPAIDHEIRLLEERIALMEGAIQALALKK